LDVTFIHRKTTAPKITSEQIESSTESEEEDDRVLDGKVNVADLPSEFWQIQRLVKYLRVRVLCESGHRSDRNAMNFIGNCFM